MPELSGRDDFESNLARRLGRTGSVLARQIISLIPDPPDPTFTLSQDTLDTIAQAYTEALLPELERIYIAGAEGQQAALGISVDFDVVNQRAADWTRQYTYELEAGITQNSARQLQAALGDYFEQRTTLRDLEERIARTFGPGRAATIAITETTRAAVQGELAIQQELGKMGVRTVLIWRTAMDSRVCPICGPLDGTRQGEEWTYPPPAHSKCRCWTSAEIIVEA